MKYLFLFVILSLAGCKVELGDFGNYEEDSRSAYVTITCYDYQGKITVRKPHYQGPIEMVNDPSFGYRSQKCVLERE
jgi:hypothetical protein